MRLTRRTLITAAASAALTARFPLPVARAAAPRTCYAFYYPWWGAKPSQTTYVHWDGGNPNRPGLPNNITAVQYPLLNPYDSHAQTTLYYHIGWAVRAKIDVLVVSWWGRGSYEDRAVPALLAAAAQNGVKVAFLIEPYSGRSAASVRADITYLNATYGTSPAYHRVSRPTLYGPSLAPRPVIFIWDVGLTPDPSWAQMADAIRGTADDALLIERSDDAYVHTDATVRQKLALTHADGLFSYGAMQYPAGVPVHADYLIVPAIAPGWDDTRAPGRLNPSVISRNNGDTFNGIWTQATTLGPTPPEAVAICSFNEWHEGTTIEPCKPWSYKLSGQPRYTYQNVEGHFGLTGAAAQTSYLDRNAYHVDRWRAMP